MQPKGNKNMSIEETIQAFEKWGTNHPCNMVSKWVREYKEGGIKYLDKPVGGRHNENMTLEEERKFLEGFEEKAEKGQIIEVKEIKKEYEKRTKASKSKGQIYAVLHRHGWRKVKPRSRHPKKASNEKIEESKKT